jgi:hypothetical protein
MYKLYTLEASCKSSRIGLYEGGVNEFPERTTGAILATTSCSKV